MEIDDRIAEVRCRVAEASLRSGRTPDDVLILPATKKHPPETIDYMATQGFQCFGESKVQEAGHKTEQCSSGLEWHMIGHLQSNKVNVAVQLFSCIQSVDSIGLLEKLNHAAVKNGDRLNVYLQVNVADEKSKSGFHVDAVPAALEAAQELMQLNVIGMMLIPPYEEDVEKVRPWFVKLRELRDKWHAESGFPLEELSMGMSNDYTIAIEEGATVVRLGRCLVGPRSKAL